MKKHLNKIELWGAGLLLAAFVITTLWGSDHAFFPMIIAVATLAVVGIYKAVHWDEYRADNRRNAWIVAAVVAFMAMYTVFGM